MAAFCVLLLALPNQSFSSQFPGLPVTQVVIQDDEGHPWPHPERITPLINVKPGDAFSSEAIRNGISYLYLKGLFKDVRVDGFPGNGGVKLVYTLIPITAVDNVVIKGNHALSTSKIMDAIPGVEGKELREDKFPEYRTAIATLYQSEGYHDTIVDFQVKKRGEPHHVELRIEIREPKPTIIAAITFSGNTVFTDKQLLKAMESKVGKPLRSDVLLDTDTAAILEKYTKAGYPAAKSGPVDISFRDGKAYIRVYGTEGPNVTVRFSGNHAFSDRALRKQILIWSEHDVSDAIIDSSSDKIKNLYKDDGYANVKVEVKKTEAPGRLDLTFGIQEGRRITVKDIIIQGNSYFPTKQIRGEISLEQSGWFSSSPFREDLVDKAVEYLRDRYLDAGFLSVDVKWKVALVDNGVKAVVQIDINEGPQTRAGAITFEGNHAFSDSELLARLSLKPGAPYNERLVDEDRYRILSVYSDKGYLYARVESEKKPTDGTIDVKYKIVEDQPVRIGRIILRGNERTKESVIMRELLLKPGDAYDYEKILKSQQRIYRFGYFNQARFELVHPGVKEYVKDMILSVEERPAGAFEVGVGYGDLDRARASVEVSHRNVWGLAHYAGVRFEDSDILKRAILNYQHPWFFGYDMQGKFALAWSDTKHINSDTREIYYQTRQTSASYGVEKKLDSMKASLTYALERVDNYNVEPGAILSPQDVGYVRVSSLSPALVWDLRDDIFNPRKGALYGIVVKQAMHQLGSEADFTKVSVQSSWYIPVSTGIISALSAKAGMAWPHYQTLEVPLHERFYLGGSTTVRGYTQDAVGPSAKNPDGTTTPTGGSGMWLLNAELRMMPSEGFGFVLFSDMGRVWINQQEQSGLTVNQPDQFRPPARASYGAGIRYGTPIGPLRIDYGQKIHRRPGESPGELHFNIGHTF
jgi:outer membrane protein insertion porin family